MREWVWSIAAALWAHIFQLQCSACSTVIVIIWSFQFRSRSFFCSMSWNKTFPLNWGNLPPKLMIMQNLPKKPFKNKMCSSLMIQLSSCPAMLISILQSNSPFILEAWSCSSFNNGGLGRSVVGHDVLNPCIYLKHVSMFITKSDSAPKTYHCSQHLLTVGCHWCKS